MSRYVNGPYGVTELKPHRWYDSTVGARFGLAAAITLSLLIAAAFIRAVAA